jgi:uncharacterized membrane protein
MAVVWALLLAGGYNLFRRYARGAAVIAILVVSHWFLDAPMHRPDLPLWPGSATTIGAGLWNSIGATVAIEGSLLIVGIFIYVRATRPRDRVGTYALASMLAFLVLIFVSGFFTPPPPSERALALVGLGAWLFVPWAYWIDRHRESSRLHGMG